MYPGMSPSLRKRLRSRTYLQALVLKTVLISPLDSVTEQPYKIPYYAALMRLLHNPSEPPLPEQPPVGRVILEEFWKGFQSYLDKVAWRETRLCVSFQTFSRVNY